MRRAANRCPPRSPQLPERTTLRGINLGNALDALSDGPRLRASEAHLDAIWEVGFDAVRLPVRWSAHAAVTAPYTLEPSFADRVDRLVRAALDRRLRVVLDLHHYDELQHDPHGHAERFTALWDQLAARYADHPPTLWLELLNEPRAALTAPIWNALLRRGLAAIRAADPTRTVVIGPVAQNDIAALDDLDLPPDPYLVAGVHYYAPMRFTHQGAHWVDGAAGWLGTTWEGTDAERAAVTIDLERAAAWARERGVPLLVGEFGTFDLADPASRVRWTTYVRGELDRLGVNWCYWDFGTDFGAYDLDREAWREPLLRALMPGSRPGYGAAATWVDDFDGPAGAPVDPSIWGFEVGGHGWGNAELQTYADSTANAGLDGDGNLAITVRREARGGYTSARLVTKDRVAFRYGTVSARIRLPGGRGVWPAFWMLGQDIDAAGWPGCGEIDVLENFGTDPSAVHGTVHGPGYAGQSGVTGSFDAGVDLAEDFHEYAVRWEPGRIRWLFDRRPYHQVTPADLPGPWVFDHDFYLLLNVAVGGRFSVPPAADLPFPRTMLVDWIRVEPA